MKKLLTFAACLTATALLHAQTTIFVTPDGTGDGTSWANACNLETAVVRSLSGAETTEIWVQSGTYNPSKMLVVPASVKIYGGFVGTETNLSQRNFFANLTIIDGQQKVGSIFRLGKSAELNGLTVQHGNANGTPHKNGGGVWADDNAIIANCIIQNNAAIADGGGIYAKGNLNLVNSTVENNTASDGADLYGNCITQVTVFIPIAVPGCNDGTFDFGAVHFETANEYTITGTVDGEPLTQIWSDAVWTDNCQKTTYASGLPGNFNSDCRTNPGYSGDFFSWCAVVRFADVLCPAPWRVPTMDDFVNLDKAMGGTGANAESNNGGIFTNITLRDKYLNSWGGAYGGYYGGDLIDQGSQARYWSQTEGSSDSSGYYLYLDSYGIIYPQTNFYKSLGFTLRCVR